MKIFKTIKNLFSPPHDFAEEFRADLDAHIEKRLQEFDASPNKTYVALGYEISKAEYRHVLAGGEVPKWLLDDIIKWDSTMPSSTNRVALGATRKCKCNATPCTCDEL